MMSNEELTTAIFDKVNALREEADKLEHFALHSLNYTPPSERKASTLPTMPATASERPAWRDTKNPRLQQTIIGLLQSAPNQTATRKELIAETKRAYRGKVHHVAIVATLRNEEVFKQIAEGVFTLNKH